MLSCSMDHMHMTNMLASESQGYHHSCLMNWNNSFKHDYCLIISIWYKYYVISIARSTTSDKQQLFDNRSVTRDFSILYNSKSPRLPKFIHRVSIWKIIFYDTNICFRKLFYMVHHNLQYINLDSFKLQ